MSSDNAKKAVLQVLRIALLEIRHQAHLSGDKVAYRLADLIHTLPGMIENAPVCGDWEPVLKDIQERADHMGCSKWVENRIREISNERPGS